MTIQENPKTISLKKDVPVLSKNASSFAKIGWGESYVSLLFGAMVVIFAAVLGFFYVKVHQPKQELLPPVTTSRNLKLTVKQPSSLIAVGSNQKVEQEKATNSALPTVGEKQKNEQRQHIYTVQKNDDLWNIAQKEYGSGYSWVAIAKANNITHPGVIFAGNKLIIPSVTPIIVNNNPIAVASSPTQPIPAMPTKKIIPTTMPSISQTITITGSEYVVKKGDSLWNIAVRSYGDGYKWVLIAKANNLANPGAIFSGNSLHIPRPQQL